MKPIVLDAAGYTAWILPARGGSCIRLARFGAEALRTPPSEDAYVQDNPFLWGTPLLFLPNRISAGTFLFEGRTYTLPVNEPATGCFLHGTLHQMPFAVVEQRGDGVLLRYAATRDAPYLTYPHPFALTLRWQLGEEGLVQEAAIRNDSHQNMPVALAFHTTFCLPFAPGGVAQDVRLTLDTSREYSRNMANYLPDGGAFDLYPDQQAMAEGTYAPSRHAISRLFRMGEGRTMCLHDPHAGVKLTYQASEPYGYWMLYNGGNADFLCVEPQSWLSNCPNAPFDRGTHGFDWLAPGESRLYRTLMRMERI